ncbi:MAG: hypothetical protein K8R06_02285, partial [Methanosarcinales archaeon]|nr:hypothetical protein [Methanosarcinales archaeon]
HYHLHTSKLILYEKLKISDRIFGRMDIDIMDVIEAAATKWNFNVYYPGAGVGGHCLPVDPYYLVTKAEELGYHSKAITTGRGIKNSKVFVLGFSYKENVGEMLHHLRQRGVKYCKDLCLKTANNPGPRPEIIKMCPVIRKCERGGENSFIHHMGRQIQCRMD